MRIVISKSELLRVAKPVVQAAAKKSSAQPVYEHVLLAATDDLLNLYAGDGIIYLSGACKAEVKEEGQIAVHAADLLKRIESMPDGPIVIASESINGVINAYSMRSQTSARKHSYPCLSGDDFPEAQAQDKAIRFAVSAAKVRSVLERVKHSAHDDANHWMSFIFFRSSGNRITATATCGHNGAHSWAELNEPIDPFSANISSTNVDRICAVLGEMGDVTITVGDRVATFSYDCFDCTVTLGADDPPPAFLTILEVDKDVETFEVNTSVLLDAVKAVRLAVDDKACAGMFQVKGGSLSITTESADRGKSSDEIPNVQYSDTVATRFNVDMIRAALDGSKCERVRMYLPTDDSLQPAYVRGTGYHAIVMPQRD